MAQTSFVQTLARLQTEESAVLIMRQEYANGVEQNLSLTSIQKQKPVAEVAGISCVGIKAIRKNGVADVYNLEVEDNHNFSVNNGLIVHNCMDAMRYFIKTKRLVAKDDKRRSREGR